MIDISMYKKYWENFQEPKIYFMVDQLMRLYLATKGDFYFINRPIWIYTDTSRNTNLSVHNNVHVYDQDITFLRYQSEQEFILNEIDDKLRDSQQIYSFKFWLNVATRSYVQIMTDEGLRNHYGIEPKEVNIDYERQKFLEYVSQQECRLDIGNQSYYESKSRLIEENIKSGNEYVRQVKAHNVAMDISQETLLLIKEMKSMGISIKDLLRKNGYEQIGIYGTGYLGRIVWNEMIESGIKPVYVCDKKYKCETKINDYTYAISPQFIEKYDIDILLITPLQFSKEIMEELKYEHEADTIYRFLKKELAVYMGK